MKIRDLEINNGRPAVCVPVTDRTAEDIVSHVSEITEQTDIIEWRVDYYDDVDRAAMILPEIREAAGDTPVLVTLRTEQEGGEFRGNSSGYTDILNGCAADGNADLIDVEYRAVPDIARLLDFFHEKNVRSVVSHHDFHETPDEKEMYAMLEAMADTGADIVKLAVMPQTVHDVLALLSVTYRFHALHPKTPVVTMSMGRLGVVSRIAGGTFGSCITFGADRVASAPGQLEYLELKLILRILDEAGK